MTGIDRRPRASDSGIPGSTSRISCRPCTPSADRRARAVSPPVATSAPTRGATATSRRPSDSHSSCPAGEIVVSFGAGTDHHIPPGGQRLANPVAQGLPERMVLPGSQSLRCRCKHGEVRVTFQDVRLPAGDSRHTADDRHDGRVDREARLRGMALQPGGPQQMGHEARRSDPIHRESDGGSGNGREVVILFGVAHDRLHLPPGDEPGQLTTKVPAHGLQRHVQRRHPVRPQHRHECLPRHASVHSTRSRCVREGRPSRTRVPPARSDPPGERPERQSRLPPRRARTCPPRSCRAESSRSSCRRGVPAQHATARWPG